MHSHPSRNDSFWPAVIVILLLGLALRLIQNMTMPLFLDEGLHILRAQRGAEGQLFFWNIRKWLYPAFLTLLRPLGPEGPWLSRSLSALFGVFTTGIAISLGRRFGGTRAALGAGLIYAVLPLAVFHERQALADPFLAMLDGLVIILSVWLATRPRWWHAPLLGISFAAAYLTKISALPYVSIPILSVILLARNKARLHTLIIALTGIALAAAIIAFTYNYVLSHGGITDSPLDVTLSRFSELAGGEDAARGTGIPASERLAQGLTFATGIVPNYIGWGVALLVIATVLGAFAGDHRSETTFLLFPAIVFAVGPMVASRPLDASRYFVPNALPLAVFAGLGLQSFTRRIVDQRSRFWVSAGALLVILAPALWFDLTLITNPIAAPLTKIDHSEYFQNSPAGGPYAEAMPDLAALWQVAPATHLDILSPSGGVWIPAYLGPRVGEVSSDSSESGPLSRWLAQGDRVFLLDDSAGGRAPSMRPEISATPFGTYTDGFRTVTLWEVTGASGTLADSIYSQQVPPPDRISSDYQALAAALRPLPPDRRIVIFPAEFAQELSQGTDRTVEGLRVSQWPPTQEAAARAFEQLHLGTDGQVFDVVLVDETTTDPRRILLSALQAHYYYLADMWFGLLHQAIYVTGPIDLPLASVDAHFEGDIQLTSGALIDESPVVGDDLRIVLTWRTPVPIRDSFNIFVHIVDNSGALVAQYDGVPAAGLRPMPTWESGEIVTDRIAVSLPSDLPPGQYTIRVGIYNPASQLRLPVISAAESGGDYVVVWHFRLEAANQ